VQTGREAVAAVTDRHYALVLMDAQMPDLDGFEATAAIREMERRGGRGPQGTRLPIIAMTATATTGTRETCLAAGMDDYVAKPIQLEQLREIVERWMPQDVGDQEAGVTAVNDAAALDPQMLARLRALHGGEDVDVVGELGDVFLSVMPGLLDAIRTAIATADASTLCQAAHSAKGSSASIGAVVLANVCAELEELGEGGEVVNAGGRLSRVEAEFGRVRVALERERASPGTLSA
jgi:CheY-like chemotaxis protein